MPDRLRLRDIRQTSTFRLSIVFGAIFAAGMIALLALVYVQTARELTARSDHILRTQAATLLAAPADHLPRIIAEENAGSPANLSYIALLASDGERVVGNIAPPPGLRSGTALDTRDRTTGKPIRLFAVRTGNDETLIVGRDVSQIDSLRATIRAILLWTGVAIVIAGFAIGVALSLRPLRRVQGLAAAAREIGRGDLAVRMPLGGRGDELDMFARTVNEMIEQVERVVGQVKIVTDAVAHDLRTPLARLRSRLYGLSRESGDPEVAAMLGDLDAVLDRFAALLRISELEAARGEARFVAVDLGALLATVVDLYAPVAEERGQRLMFVRTTDAVVAADPELLFEAVGNLVDNAIKFSPAGGTIAVELTPDGDRSSLTVRDSGPGIAVAERSAVLRRFYRGAEAVGVAGSGLGLSLVAAIAHLHRAELTLDDAAPGLIVRLTLPSAR